jgi:excisionase family DNA binding protein
MPEKPPNKTSFTLDEIAEFFEEKYSTKEAAGILKLEESTVRKLLRRKKLGHYKLGRKRVIGKSHLLRYLAANQNEPRTYSKIAKHDLITLTLRQESTTAAAN